MEFRKVFLFQTQSSLFFLFFFSYRCVQSHPSGIEPNPEVIAELIVPDGGVGGGELHASLTHTLTLCLWETDATSITKTPLTVTAPALTLMH